MSRILLDESLSSDAFDGAHSKKAFREPQLHTPVRSIRLTSLSWREIASTGQTPIELRSSAAASSPALWGPRSVLTLEPLHTSGLLLQTRAQTSS